jgi:hypothetical protein
VPFDPSSLVWPLETSPPWVLVNTTVAFRSVSGSQRLASFLGTTAAPDLGGRTYAEVLDEFKQAGCPLWIRGSAVRDAILGVAPREVSVEFICDMPVFGFHCTRLFGSQCHFNNQTGAFYLGTPSTVLPLQGLWWEKSINVPDYAHDYTVNVISYDSAEAAFLDWRAYAIPDLCTGKLRIAASEADWSLWLEEKFTDADGGYRKLPLFWWLASAPFSLTPTPNVDTTNFIAGSTVQSWGSVVAIRTSFASFLCKYVGGTLGGGECTVAAEPSQQTLVARQAYVARMAQDVGQAFIDAHILSLLAYTVSPPQLLRRIPRRPHW